MSEPAPHGLRITRHVARRVVEHADIDGYRVVHFARYAVFAETAALALLDANGLGLRWLEGHGIELRVRDLRLRYRAAAVFGDALAVEAEVTRPSIAHVVVGIRVRRDDDAPEPAVLVDGELDLVFVEAATGRPLTVAAALGDRVGQAT